MAGEVNASGNGNGWQSERAEVLSQLAVQSNILTRVEAQLENVNERLANYGREHVMEEARREIVREMFAAVEQLQEEMPERLGERLWELERYLPAVKVLTWVGTLLGASMVALIWAMITGQVLVVVP